MIQFIVGAVLVAVGIGIILALQKPEDQFERVHNVSLEQVLLSNLVLVLIMTGGALIALALV